MVFQVSERSIEALRKYKINSIHFLWWLNMASSYDYKIVHDALQKMEDDKLYEASFDERVAMKAVLEEQEEHAATATDIPASAGLPFINVH